MNNIDEMVRVNVEQAKFYDSIQLAEAGKAVTRTTNRQIF